MSISLQEGAAIVGRVRDAVATRVVGQDDAIEDVLVAFLARGHVLIEGVPGTAKTLLVRAVANAMAVRFKRIQFTPDLMPADVTGVATVSRPNARVRVPARPGVHRSVARRRDQSCAGENPGSAARSDGRATGDRRRRGPAARCVVHGARDAKPGGARGHIPAARSAARPVSASRSSSGIRARPPSWRCSRCTSRGSIPSAAVPDRSWTRWRPPTKRAACRALVDGVRVAPEMREYIAAITRATREDPSLVLGASPRATIALMRAARAGAVLDGRDYVTPDDVKARAPAVLRHR